MYQWHPAVHLFPVWCIASHQNTKQPHMREKPLCISGKYSLLCGMCSYDNRTHRERNKGLFLNQRVCDCFYLIWDKQSTEVREGEVGNEVLGYTLRSIVILLPTVTQGEKHGACTHTLIHTCTCTLDTQSSQRASALWKQAVSHQSHQPFALSLLTFTHSIMHSFISPPLLNASILSFICPSLPSNPSFQPGLRLCWMIHVFILWWKDALNISCQS